MEVVDAPMVDGRRVSLLKAKLRVRRARRRLTLRGISAMALEERSSVVRLPLRDRGASRMSKGGTLCKSSPDKLSDVPAVSILWFTETSSPSSSSEDETKSPPSSSDDASLAIVVEDDGEEVSP